MFRRSNALMSNVVKKLCDDATAVSMLTHGDQGTSRRRTASCITTVLFTIDVVFLHFVVLVLVFDQRVFRSVCPCLLVVSIVTTTMK